MSICANELVAAIRRHPARDAAGATTLTADVLIVGGGFVGLSPGLRPRRQRLRASSSSKRAIRRRRSHAGFDGRASAIALTSRRLLSAIGVWEKLADEAAPMLDIRVSEGASRLFLHYDHREVGDEPFGHMLENRVLRRALLERLQRDAGDPAAGAGARRASSSATTSASRPGWPSGQRDPGAAGDRRRRPRLAHPRRGRHRRHPLVLPADRHRLHGRARAAARASSPTSISCRPGPFAILPLLPETRSSIVWTERRDLAPAIMALDDAGFTRELRHRFGDFLGDVRPVGPRFCLSAVAAVRGAGDRYRGWR